MKRKKILIINICKEQLHYYEFVKPIEEIVADLKLKYVVKHYKELRKKDIEKADKIIICGTSLQDNEFAANVEQFLWLRSFNGAVLGICGGLEIIGLVFGGKLKKKTEIGFYREKFRKNFLGLSGTVEVYHLHNYFVDFKKLKTFEIFSGGEIVQAVKHREKEIYGVLFHPEIRNKEMIIYFAEKI